MITCEKREAILWASLEAITACGFLALDDQTLLVIADTCHQAITL
jgi:hypothetical protein